MLSGEIKPIKVKIFRARLRYWLHDLPRMVPLRVIGWDMKYLLVADEMVLRAYKVLWKDIELVDSEKVVQVPVVHIEDRSKTINRPREKPPFFKAGTKPTK